MRYDEYDEVTSLPSDAQILANRPSVTDATYVHGTPARITPANLLAETVDLSSAQTVGGAKTFTDDLLVDKGSGYANGTFAGPGDGAQYANFNLADSYPLDVPGNHYWAFSHRADSPVNRFLIFNFNGTTYTNVMEFTEGGAITTLACTLEDGAGNMAAAGAVQPGNGTAPGGHLYSGAGAPDIPASVAGDAYLRTDTPGTANQRLYIATAANTWTGIL